MNKCVYCPLRDLEVACPAIANPHPRFCELMDPTHPDFDPRYARPIRIMAGVEPPPPPQDVVAVVAPEPIRRHHDIPLAGDVVERLAKRIGADRLAAWWEKKTGTTCGCGARRDAMNRASETLLRWLR